MKHDHLKIKEMFGLLRQKPSMIMSGDITSLNNYIVFFEGFFISLKFFNNIDIEREISEWYQNHVDIRAANMYWFAQFKMVNKEKTEAEKIENLVNIIEVFLLKIFPDSAQL